MSAKKLADLRVLPLKITTPSNSNLGSTVSNLSYNAGRSHNGKRPQKKHLSIDSIINSSKAKSPSVSTLKNSLYHLNEPLSSNLPSQNVKTIKHSFSKNSILTDHDKSYNDLFIDIETKFQEILNRKQETGISQSLFEEVQRIFDDVIFAMPAIKEVLQGIKKFYDEFIKSTTRSLKEENEKLKQKIYQIERNCELEAIENQSLIKRIQDISKENLKLGKFNEKIEKKCEKLQKYLIEINEVSLENVPIEKENWKVVICKNKKYKEIIGKLENRVKVYKERLRMNVTLFASLNQLGFPVRSLCRKFISECTKEDLSSVFSDSMENEEVYENKDEPVVVLEQLDSIENSLSDR